MDTVEYFLSLGIGSLLGLIFFIAGVIMKIYPPRSINHFYGYRTPRSMKSQENWDFAQRLNGAVMIKLGLILFIILNLIAILFINIHISLDFLVISQVIIMLVSLGIMFWYSEKKIKEFEKSKV